MLDHQDRIEDELGLTVVRMKKRSIHDGEAFLNGFTYQSVGVSPRSTRRFSYGASSPHSIPLPPTIKDETISTFTEVGTPSQVIMREVDYTRCYFV